MSSTILEVSQAARASSINVQRRKQRMVWKVGGWKVKAKESYHSFRSQAGLSAKLHMGAHEPRLQMCRIVPSPERTSQKTRAMSAVSITSSRTGSGTVLMVF